MNKTHSIRRSTLALLASLPLGLSAGTMDWPTPPPVSYGAAPTQVAYDRPARSARAQAPAADESAAAPAPAANASVIYNGPVVNMAPPSASSGQAQEATPDYNPALLSRRHKADPANDPHQRGLRLGGPRFGVSYINGAGFDRLAKAVHETKPDATVDPLLIQFGWQMEYRMFRTDEGVTAISELIPLVGGLDQGLALPSCAWLVGLRNADGVEFGVGPDFGLDGASFLMATGYTMEMGGINIPLNAAVGLGANHTTSVNVSVGFNL